MRCLPSPSALRWYNKLKYVQPRQGSSATAPKAFGVGDDVRLQSFRLAFAGYFGDGNSNLRHGDGRVVASLLPQGQK
jgi:hypothetical protein